jgi:hypothetical protein
MFLSIEKLVIGSAKIIGSLVLSLGIFWQVITHSGIVNGTVYVHVSNPQVDVTIDDFSYRVETAWERPIVCELSPGFHTVRMLRNLQTLFEEDFTLAPGQEVVLTAWDQANQERAPSAAR